MMVSLRLFFVSAMFLYVGVLDANQPKQLDPVDEFCQTLLHQYARSDRNFKAMHNLLQAGYDPDQTDIFGTTPLREACDAGMLLNVICLVRYGAVYSTINHATIGNPNIVRFFEQLGMGSSMNDAIKAILCEHRKVRVEQFGENEDILHIVYSELLDLDDVSDEEGLFLKRLSLNNVEAA